MLLNCLLVSVGGAIGSLLRFLVSIGIGSANLSYPFATGIVNLLGSFLVGFISAYAGPRGLLTEPARLLLFTGIMGGFTTFSAFALETVHLSREGLSLYVFLNITFHFVICLGSAFVGFKLGTAI